MKVLCVGGTSYDITFPLPEFVENKKIIVDKIVECGGGSAYNVANLLAKWNVDTYLASIVGKDSYGEKLLKDIKKSKVKSKYFKLSSDVSTPISYIINNQEDGSRTIIMEKHSNNKYPGAVIMEHFDILYFDGHYASFANQAISANVGALKILDAGRCDDDTIKLAKSCDYIICSKDFAEEYTDMKISTDDLDTICDVYDKLNSDFRGKIIITLGEDGSFIEYNGYKLIPSINVKAVDTTGAGDVFHGAFIFALINDLDIIDAIKISNIAGGLSTLKVGSVNSIPRYGDVIEVYNGLIK